MILRHSIIVRTDNYVVFPLSRVYNFIIFKALLLKLLLLLLILYEFYCDTKSSKCLPLPTPRSTDCFTVLHGEALDAAATCIFSHLVVTLKMKILIIEFIVNIFLSITGIP